MSTDPYLTPESSGTSAANAKSIGCLWPTVIVGGILAILVFLLLPSVRRSPEASRRNQCKNNLKQIGLALYNYHDIYNSFPPAYTVDANGTKLHSWRTLILPYIEHQALYDLIDLSKPWNHPANTEAYEYRPQVFACPSSDIPDAHTTYMGLVGADNFFAGAEAHTLSQITGGTSYAVAVTEVAIAQSVHWMEPTDVGIEFLSTPGKELEVAHTGGFQVLLADGSVRFISTNTASETIQSLMSVSESVDGEF